MKNSLELFKLGIELGEKLIANFPETKSFYLVTEANEADTFARGVIEALELKEKKVSFACLWGVMDTKISMMVFIRKYLEFAPRSKNKVLVVLSSQLNPYFISSAIGELQEHVKAPIVVASAAENKENIKILKKQKPELDFKHLNLKLSSCPQAPIVKISELVRARRERVKEN